MKKLAAHFFPKPEAYQQSLIVIDVLRTTTVAPILFDQGLKELILTSSMKNARKLAEKEGYLLIGDWQGLPPRGFHFPNSPATLLTRDLSDKTAVLVAANANQLEAFTSAEQVILASLYNAEASVRQALTIEQDISLVCLGHHGESDLDDSFVAGFLGARLKQLSEEMETVDDAALAISLFKAFTDPLQALSKSRAGQNLIKLCLDDDIATSCFVAISDKVPVLFKCSNLDGTALYHFQCP